MYFGILQTIGLRS